MLDTAIARPFPTARCVHAGLGRPHSRGGANGRHQGKGFRRAALSDQPAAERRHPGKVPAAIGVVSPRTACPKTLSGPSIRAHRRIGGASCCGARSPTAGGKSFGGRTHWNARRWGISNAASSQRPPPPYRQSGFYSGEKLGSIIIHFYNLRTAGSRPPNRSRGGGTPLYCINSKETHIQTIPRSLT